MPNLFSEDQYAVVNSESIVINTISIDSSLTSEQIENILSSIGENLILVKLSEIEDLTAAGPGFEYFDGKFVPPNPEPGTSNYVYESQTNSWTPSVSYPENEPEEKYVYVFGQWTLNPAFKTL
jgi:hypothetical protein